MIARPAPSFTLNNILERFGLTSLQRHVVGGYHRPGLSRWQRIFAALGEWSSVSLLASHGEPLWRDRPERRKRRDVARVLEREVEQPCKKAFC